MYMFKQNKTYELDGNLTLQFFKGLSMKQQGGTLLLMRQSFMLRCKPFMYADIILSHQRIFIIAPFFCVSNTQVQAHSDISISPQHIKKMNFLQIPIHHHLYSLFIRQKMTGMTKAILYMTYDSQTCTHYNCLTSHILQTDT